MFVQNAMTRTFHRRSRISWTYVCVDCKFKASFVVIPCSGNKYFVLDIVIDLIFSRTVKHPISMSMLANGAACMILIRSL